MKIFITSVNAIMTIDETFLGTDYYERNLTGEISKKVTALKSYMPEDNVLWSPSERNNRFEDFKNNNKGLIGKGDTILLLGEDGNLTEYYSGVQVIPVQSLYMDSQGSNRGEACYYSINQDADNSKLYVPIDWLREVKDEDALSVLEQLFHDKKRDVEKEIIKPLKNRELLVKKNLGGRTMKELISIIINDEELSQEDKCNLVEKIVNASHGIDKFVTDGFYLHTDKNEETGEIDIQLWCRNVDENGMTDHGPTNYSANQIVDMLKAQYLNKNEKAR